MNGGPNQITGANAGGRVLLPTWTLWAARIAQFRRYCDTMLCAQMRTHE
jgi:hypothetical protein